MPWSEREVLILLQIIDGGLDVNDDGVVACSARHADHSKRSAAHKAHR